MDKKTVKVYGKLNINLNLNGIDEKGYHKIDTVVCSVNKYDLITVKKRKDDKILVTFSGRYAETFLDQSKTNAYKSAKLFMEEFKVSGVDIDILRQIPTGSGMGGSSADIVGVLIAMKKLFKITKDLKPLADKLGSDTGYMLTGGYARLTGRGEIVEKLQIDKKYYFVTMYAKSGVNTKDSYSQFDKSGAEGVVSNTEELITALKEGNMEEIGKNCKNALYKPSSELNGEIIENLNVLKSLSPTAVSMSGSGSTVFIMYDSLEFASWAYEKLKKSYGKRVDLLETVNPNKPTIFDLFLGYNQTK